jgi:hypothetical protein
MMKAMTGPRHFITSGDNKYLYALSELLGTVTTFAIDGKTGLLTEVSTATGLPPDTKLGGCAARPLGAPGGPPPRNTDNDIWAADIHITPNGKFLYISGVPATRRAFSVDGASGKLTYLSSTPTEKQPRGFNIDPGLLQRHGRKIGHDFGLRHRPGQRRAEVPQQVPDGQGRELGGDRQFRVSVQPAPQVPALFKTEEES